MNLTADQERAAFAEGSVAVVAGAGTGKTHMLTSRYLHHLTQGRLSPLEIVAVTFTEKAADELKARVRRAVADAPLDSPDTLVELEAAQISTLHALAARICREHPEAAGVPPDFGILEDLEGRVWLAEQIERAVADLPDSVFERMPYNLLAEALDQLLAEPILAARALAREPETWPELIRRTREQTTMALASNPDWQEACRALLAHAGREDDLIEIARRHALRGIAALGQGDHHAAFDHFDSINRRGGSAKKWPEGGLQDVKDALKVIQDTAKVCCSEGLILLEFGAVDEALVKLLHTLREAFTLARDSLSAAKRRARVLDFADLEAHALEALEHPHVRAHYRERWKAFLVDEFQDTNPVQATLLDRLTADAIVTIVGDEKQAIYGFRGADTEVFRRYRSRLSREGTEVGLSESFRTHAALATALNTTFAPVLRQHHQPLSAWRREAPHDGPCLTLHTVEAEKGVPKLLRRVAEARAIGQAVRDLLDRKEQVYDPITGSLRPIRPDDVAVLARTWSPLEVYGEILPAFGVPTVHTGGGSLLDTREAKDSHALLRFLADPGDDVALVALLRSPFFALDDRTLQTFAQALPQDGIWWEGLQDQSDPPFIRVRQLLQELLDVKRDAAPSRLLQRADYLTGYTAVITNLPGATRRQADWRGFLDLVRRLERGTDDVFAVVRRLRRLARAGAKIPRPTLTVDGAVALMTIHKAKGLEWPVVVVADLDYTPPSGSDPVLMDHELGVAFKIDEEDGTTGEPALYTLLKHRERQRERDEAKRACYVALTRARDRLILTGTKGQGGALDLLAPGFQALNLACEPIPYDPSSAVYPDAPPPTPMPDSGGESADLWDCAPSGLGEYARYVDAKGCKTAPPAPQQDAWEEVLLLIREMDEVWLPIASALREAGVPAPDPDTVFKELTVRGVVAPYPAVCMWPQGGLTVALVDAATPDGEYDQRLLRGDPEASWEDISRTLLETLRGDPCAS